MEKGQKEIWHWIPNENYTRFQNGQESNTACGEKVFQGMRFSTECSVLVNCHECIKKHKEIESKNGSKIQNKISSIEEAGKIAADISERIEPKLSAQ